MNNLLQDIKKIVDFAKNCGDLDTPITRTYYVNNLDETDFFRTLEEAVERKLNLGDYTKVDVEESAKQDIFKMGIGDITKEDVENVKYFAELLERISPDLEFKRLLHNLTAKIQIEQKKVKTLKGKRLEKAQEKLLKAREERVNLYFQYEVEPRKTFQDYDLYEETYLRLSGQLG